MIPSDPARTVIDPGRLVREQGREALAELVARESGYIFQLRPLKDLCLFPCSFLLSFHQNFAE